MMARARMLAGRLAVVLVAGAACLLAWRFGGGAEGATPPPRADELDAGEREASTPTFTPTPTMVGGQGYEVALRLVEVVGGARAEVPNAAMGQELLGAHWRKMRPAWFATAGDNARFVSTVALRTSAIETQWSAPAGAGKAWTPDAKVWNLNEGSYEQRDALVATPPSTFTFEVTVPQGAKLTFSEGTLNTTYETTSFVITVVDAKGAAHEVYRHRLGPAGARRWTDASCGLEGFAGQTVALRLSTETVQAIAEERQAAAKVAREARRAELDAGIEGGSRAARIAAEGDGGAAKEEMLTTPGIGVALWGSPTLLARTVPRVPYNVLWIVVDALRPDVIASFHDDTEDAAKLAAENAPLDALLPRVPGLTPAIDDLARRGVRFTSAYSGGSWTRPGTLSMLAGARSSELGLDTERWTLFASDTARFYASDPPLLPLLARRHGVSTQAFVNNYFMVGYAPVGVEMGFERVTDHRYRTRDTLEITRGATAWIKDNRDTRFFMFVNYNSPHEPYDPPDALLERVPPPPAGPSDKIARLYMAEAAKDDEAIGVLMQSLTEAGLRERTIVVVTADHGETLSSAHGGTSALDRMAIRYHHAVSNYEETARVPILIVAPGLLPADRAVKARVRNTDLAPTITELLGLEAHPRFSGRSLVALAKGVKESDERVVVTEGRGTRGIMHGRYRLLVREGLARTTMWKDHTATANEELYDLVTDPGERHDLAATHPEVVAEMRARLTAALKNAPVVGSSAATASGEEGSGKPPVIRLRFVGGAQARRVSGSITIGDAKTKASSFTIDPVEIGRDSFKLAGEHATLALTTSAASAVGFDIVVDPAATPVTWDLYLDDQTWPDEAVFGGPYGLLAPKLRAGIASDESRLVAGSAFLPSIDPRRDVGLFVVRERGAAPGEGADPREADPEGAEEMARLLREWGYAHGTK